jgi:hypothetical protein
VSALVQILDSHALAADGELGSKLPHRCRTSHASLWMEDGQNDRRRWGAAVARRRGFQRGRHCLEDTRLTLTTSFQSDHTPFWTLSRATSASRVASQSEEPYKRTV